MPDGVGTATNEHELSRAVEPGGKLGEIDTAHEERLGREVCQPAPSTLAH
jgi:hypothetical protein